MHLSGKTGTDFLQQIVNPWYEALRNPAETQRQVLVTLLEGYAKTLYGERHAAPEVKGTTDFRANFPKISYKELCPYFEEVKGGNHTVLLSEPPLCWVMTRGSTGPAKVFPVTKTHVEQILVCGARALVNYALKKSDFELLTGKILNLNFPSTVTTIDMGGKKMTCGYSSGTYAKLNPMLDQVALLPRQEEIDALGSGIAKPDWERRFELVYERALNERVVAAMGVTPVILFFGRYINQRHGRKPKDLWNLHALFCTSVRKIQFKYGPVLRKYFGEVPIVEMYSATEGVFAQQLNDLPYITPNYDKYYFEVETGKGLKMLHELERGEWGKLIISSCLFPRYDIGDMIEAMGKNYFRVFGRANPITILEHRLYRLLFRWFL